jgi:hypothetical protein
MGIQIFPTYTIIEKDKARTNWFIRLVLNTMGQLMISQAVINHFFPFNIMPLFYTNLQLNLNQTRNGSRSTQLGPQPLFMQVKSFFLV